ncbi:MAG: aminotransferase class I/II-fold pyridoxal phosphate-dependent enzyme, partial [Mycobacteriales bacterium]
VGDGGHGAVAAVGLSREPDVIITTTLSKSLGSQGGAVLGAEAVIAHVVDSARSFIFDTGLAPVCVATASEALRVIVADPALAERACRNAVALRDIAAAAGLRTTRPAAAVVSIVIGEPGAAVAAAALMAERGVRVGCFRPPSVPVGTSRLRLTARADLTDDDIARAADGLRAIAAG